MRNHVPLAFAVALSVSRILFGAATHIEIAAGDNQTAAAGSAVGGVVCVIAKDGNNSPVSGVTITWGNVTGGGSLTGATQITGGDGIATLGSWTLGPVPGTNTITASSTGLNDLTFTATGTAGPPTQIAITSGDNQSAPGGTAVANALTVLVTDANGNAVSGATVNWGKLTGGGSIGSTASVADQNGIATLATWVLGKSLGTKTVTADCSGTSGVTFSATATAGAPTQLLVAIGNFQTAPAGTTLPDVVCAVVRDANNLPCAGITVTWGDVTGGGSITGATQITDATGIVTLGSWTLGTDAGINTTTATSGSLPPLKFTATGEVSQANANVAIQWNNALLQAVKNTKTTPPISSRAMAIVHTAMFDAWAAYDEKAVGTQLGAQLRRPEAEWTDANKITAVSYAAYRTLLDLYPAQQSIFDKVMTALSLDPTDTSVDTSSPVGIGNAAAAAVISFRHSDGSNQLGDLNPGAYSDYTHYTPVNDADTLNDPNRWQPLRLLTGQVQVFITPQWGLIKPFAIGTGKDRKRLIPKAPAKNPSKNYEKQAKELLDLSAGLDDTTKSIASYWADGGGTPTPPGHWFKIAQVISARDKHTLDDDIKLFFALGNAMMDAAIACWDTKIKYDSERPVTAIRFLYKGKSIQAWGGPGQGTQTIAGQTWQSYIQTPAFAEYTSGHSTFSAAGAQIMRSFARNDDLEMSATIPAGSSLIEPNVPAADITLSWKTLTDAAAQAGMSRRYGGIHFKDGDMNGRKCGKLIGALVWKKAQQYIQGNVK